ncbi:unnamed protein product [Ixodes hexagonus]
MLPAPRDRREAMSASLSRVSLALLGVMLIASRHSTAAEVTEEEDGLPWWDFVRRDRLSAGVCASDEKDLCGGTPELSTSPYMCRCDSDCERFGDCCIDKSHQPPRKVPWMCLYHAGREFYGQADCPAGYEDGDLGIRIVEHCHRRGSQLKALQDVPVYSVATRTMYANVFCAVCHRDADSLKPWTVRLDCTRGWDAARVLGLLSRSRYSRTSRTMYVPSVPGLSCHLHLAETASESFFKELVGVRECRLAFSTCRDQSNTLDVVLCGRYTAMVHSPRSMANYKNYHCYRCNGGRSPMKLGALECGARAAGAGNDISERMHVILSIKTNFVDARKCPGSSGIFDPVLSRCFQEPVRTGTVLEASSAVKAVEAASLLGEILVAVVSVFVSHSVVFI